ncbi:MIF-like protein mif-2 [Trichoplax sp. H2]|uniref:L-dopachrome isomerase n=1 Tax=Trichoplax adhaerens TaxID=10228 RepID=B3RPN5_TRIAD|nr:expressed hypothetical protein [Trichoplax adhaerens]EDV28220.1 expressed hypothetical protein [Trichoplax adhaerens]RDD45333.1 MIF-like protein mif-2 [Trichoplax sp. H2]|eukprot:XP_002110054.1 expressed hypothetical protein [Trichoplax adhaerens]
MAYLNLETNLPSSVVTQEFRKNLYQLIAKNLPDSNRLIMNVITDSPIIHGLSDKPYTLYHLTSTNGLGVQENKVHSKNITDLTQAELGVTLHRIKTLFHILNPHELSC